MGHANDNGPLGKVYDLAEAATYLKMTNRALARIAKKTSHCSLRGRDILFSESDLLAIWDSMRCPSNSSSALPKVIGTSGALSEERAFSNLLSRAAAKRQKRSESKRKRAC